MLQQIFTPAGLLVSAAGYAKLGSGVCLKLGEMILQTRLVNDDRSALANLGSDGLQRE